MYSKTCFKDQQLHFLLISVYMCILIEFLISILAPTKASKIWAEEDMEFHSTSQQVANWGKGAKSFNQGNKGPNSTLVHYANSDSD